MTIKLITCTAGETDSAPFAGGRGSQGADNSVSIRSFMAAFLSANRESFPVDTCGINFTHASYGD